MRFLKRKGTSPEPSPREHAAASAAEARAWQEQANAARAERQREQEQAEAEAAAREYERARQEFEQMVTDVRCFFPGDSVGPIVPSRLGGGRESIVSRIFRSWR